MHCNNTAHYSITSSARESWHCKAECLAVTPPSVERRKASYDPEATPLEIWGLAAATTPDQHRAIEVDLIAVLRRHATFLVAVIVRLLQRCIQRRATKSILRPRGNATGNIFLYEIIVRQRPYLRRQLWVGSTQSQTKPKNRTPRVV
jgi:hypothetical protein